MPRQRFLASKVPARIGRYALVVALALLAGVVDSRLALAVLVITSVIWLERRDTAGTWTVLYVLLLMIAAVMAMLLAAMTLIHRLASG